MGGPGAEETDGRMSAASIAPNADKSKPAYTQFARRTGCLIYGVNPCRYVHPTFDFTILLLYLTASVRSCTSYRRLLLQDDNIRTVHDVDQIPGGGRSLSWISISFLLT